MKRKYGLFKRRNFRTVLATSKSTAGLASMISGEYSASRCNALSGSVLTNCQGRVGPGTDDTGFSVI